MSLCRHIVRREPSIPSKVLDMYGSRHRTLSVRSSEQGLSATLCNIACAGAQNQRFPTGFQYHYLAFCCSGLSGFACFWPVARDRRFPTTSATALPGAPLLAICREPSVLGQIPGIVDSRRRPRSPHLPSFARCHGSAFRFWSLAPRICHRTGAPLSAPFLPYRTPTSHTPAPRPLPGVPAGSFPGYAGTYAFVEALSQSAGNTTHGVFSRGAI